MREYQSCKHLGDAAIDINSEFAVYVPSVDIPPFQTIQSTHFRFHGYQGTKNDRFNIDAEVHLGLSQGNSDNCEASNYRTLFKGTGDVRLNNNGYTYIYVTSLLQKIVNSSIWDNGTPLMVLFKSRNEGYGILKNGTTNIRFTSYTMTCKYKRISFSFVLH